MAGESTDGLNSDLIDRRSAAALTPELAELVEWEAEQRRRDARRAELLAFVAESGVCDLDHGQRPHRWLADACSLPETTTRTLVRVAEHLHRHYPPLSEALADGRVGWHHATAFDRAANSRIRDQLRELLPDLIALAEIATYERWHRELAGIAERLDQDGGYDPGRDPANNHLHLHTTLDGVTHITGQLVGELALRVRAVIDAHTTKILERHRADAIETGDPDSVPSTAQCRAEALDELLETAAGVPDADGTTLNPELVVIYDTTHHTLCDHDGNALSPTVLRWILAAGLLRPLETTDHHDALRMGHLIRFANRHQRRALTVRDGGCTFPGCHRPAHRCHAHHVNPWNDELPHLGGSTDIEELALLCFHHHRVTHRPGWHMERWNDPDTPDAIVFRWRTPAGRVIYSQRHGQRWQPGHTNEPPPHTPTTPGH